MYPIPRRISSAAHVKDLTQMRQKSDINTQKSRAKRRHGASARQKGKRRMRQRTPHPSRRGQRPRGFAPACQSIPPSEKRGCFKNPCRGGCQPTAGAHRAPFRSPLAATSKSAAHRFTCLPLCGARRLCRSRRERPTRGLRKSSAGSSWAGCRAPPSPRACRAARG